MKNIIVIFTVLIAAFQSLAAVRFVCPDGPQTNGAYLSWANAATNIQAAIDVSISGDEIVVTNGIYESIVVSSNITIVSVNGAKSTIIDGRGINRCVVFDNASAVIKEFTIRNGKVNLANGGGIYFDNNGRAENCIIIGNTAKQGGGVYFDNGGTLRNCLIISNSANNGGGISFDTTGTVQNCTIVNNTASSLGGGVYAISGGKIINSIIYLNTGVTDSNVYSPGDLASFSYCCSMPLLSGTGNISNSPNFLNKLSNRYQLNRGSACINGGTNFIWMSGTFDLDDNLRISDGIVDIGAYEYLLPFIDIITTNALLSYDLKIITVSGTNNLNIVGEMQFANSTESFKIVLAANQNWAVGNVPLDIGINVIQIEGTNRYGILTNDTITITRGDYGTGIPFINITNTTPETLSYDITSYTIGGTNNPQTVGEMWWTNTLTHNSGTLGPFAVETAGTNWIVPDIPLAVGANQIIIFGSNFWNIITNDVITITRGGCGTGLPFVNITNTTPETLSYDITSYTIGGTNNPQIVGEMWWTNTLNHNSGTFGPFAVETAGTNWTIPDIPLAVGANQIIIFGSNFWNIVTNDVITITRDDYGTGIPFIDITNTTPEPFSYDIASYTIGGTNNPQIVGEMWWTNTLTHNSGTFGPFAAEAAGVNWTVPDIPLAIGTNKIIIFGSNLWNIVTNDAITITRSDYGTGLPFVNITNTTLKTIGYDVTSCTIGGTNNPQTVGGMWWTNTLTHNFGTLGPFAVETAGTNWTVPDISLAIGTNQIIIFGSNFWNIVTNDAITITRGDYGTGIPFINITNTTPETLSYDITSYTIGGTNNPQIVGEMWWINTLNHNSGTFGPFAVETAGTNWTVADIPLAAGANQIIIFGSNFWNIVTNDVITITRGDYGTGIPFINITNTTPETLSYDIASYTIGGTNNQVVGEMWWTNTLTHKSGTFEPFAVGANWAVPDIPLAVGVNQIIIFGSNFWNIVTNDAITITRSDYGTGLPFVNITNTTLKTISYDITSCTIGGTNNPQTVGGMWWTNTLTHNFGILGPFAVETAGTNWTVPDISLAIGTNQIIIFGSNFWNIVTNDIITITRNDYGTSIPFINITNTTPEPFSYDIASYTIGGTNNPQVVGEMWWTNTLNHKSETFGPFAAEAAGTNWIVPDIPLAIGTNQIIIFGSNFWNIVTNDAITITRGDYGTGIPFINITNTNPETVNYDITSYTVGGTNNPQIVGGMWWTNTFTGDNLKFPASNNWTISDVDIEVGTNFIYVFGTNVFGVQTNDILTIIRMFYTNDMSVLCTWPELIGLQQTGTVEFISSIDSSYTLFVGTQQVVSGICTTGWNILEFFAGNLPFKEQTETNMLELVIEPNLKLNAGNVTVVETDLKINPKTFVEDLDGDLIYVKYISKADGKLRTEGRTLFIENGNANDKLIIKVKPAKGKGDGVCRISGIFCNGDLGMIKIPGSLDRLIVNGSLKKLMLKGGSLGHNCKTKLHNVKFRSNAGKSLIKTVARKNKLDKKVIPANVFANILCGEINDEGTIELEVLKMISIVGGNLGIENNRKTLDAKAVANVIVKPKNNIDGNIIDYSFYLTGEEKQGGGMSFKKIMANNIIDSNSSNSYFICGYDTDIKTNSFPHDVSGDNWTNYVVKYNFGKIIVKDSVLNGTFVIKDWIINKGKIKQVKAKIAGTDDAFWIVNQEIETNIITNITNKKRR